MAIPALAFVVGALVSLGTSWILVSRLERVGERFGLSEALLGMLAALAADTPEIAASVSALSQHQRAIGAGVVIGSNVFNLAALLGLGAVVAGFIGLHRRVVVLGGAVALWVSLMCFGTVTGGIEPGVSLAGALIVLVPYVVVLGMRRTTLRRIPLPNRSLAWLSSAIDEEELELVVAVRPRRGRMIDGLTAVGALIVVVLASITMERGASELGRRYHLPDAVVGGVVLAAVTSLPNAVAAVHLASGGRGAAAFSTALSSNNLNVVAGLLIPATFIGLAAPSDSGLLIVGSYVALTVLTLVLCYVRRGLGRRSGWIIIASYLAFVVWLVVIS